MAKIVYYMAAVLCLICVIAICIAPDMDLPDTHLQSSLMALMLMLCLVAGASWSIRYLIDPVCRVRRRSGSRLEEDYRITKMIVANCVLQC
jgi:hypothetical protein